MMTNAEKLSHCIWLLEYNKKLTDDQREEIVVLLNELRRDEWDREEAVVDEV